MQAAAYLGGEEVEKHGFGYLVFPLTAFAVLATLCSSANGQETNSTGPSPAAIENFEADVAEFRSRFEKQPWDSLDAAGVRRKLGDIVALDQFVRRWMMSYPRENEFDARQTEAFQEQIRIRWQDIDSKNTAELKALLEVHGWPVISRFGEMADGDAWLLVQHADHDRDFQRETLYLLETLMLEGETSPTNFAYLYDRVAAAERRPQRFGTQYHCVSREGGLTVGELEDEENVDSLRASVGLSSLDEYLLEAMESIGENITAMCANYRARE